MLKKVMISLCAICMTLSSAWCEDSLPSKGENIAFLLRESTQMLDKGMLFGIPTQNCKLASTNTDIELGLVLFFCDADITVKGVLLQAVDNPKKRGVVFNIYANSVDNLLVQAMCESTYDNGYNDMMVIAEGKHAGKNICHRAKR